MPLNILRHGRSIEPLTKATDEVRGQKITGLLCPPWSEFSDLSDFTVKGGRSGFLWGGWGAGDYYHGEKKVQSLECIFARCNLNKLVEGT